MLSVICVTEHNMQIGDESHLAIPNFKLATFYSRNNRNGGSCILIRNVHKYHKIDELNSASIPNVIECTGLELIEHKIIIVSIYRVPKNNSQNIDAFFEKLNFILNKICYKKKKIVICGDFNIDVLKRTPQSTKFKNLVASYNLKLAISEPTRLASNTCIDNIIHNVRGTTAEVIDFALSDHSAQVLKCPVRETCVLAYWYKKQRDLCKDNIDKFRDRMLELNFNDVYMANNCNDAYNSFADQFGLVYNLCFPIKRIKISPYSNPKWITKGIKKCCKRKRDLLWKYRHSKCDKLSDKVTFQTYSKRLKKVIKLTQKAQNDHFIKNSSNKTKASWNVINKNKSKQAIDNIPEILSNGKCVTSPIKIAQEFNRYFINLTHSNVNIFSTNDKNSRHMNSMTCNLPNSIFMRPTNTFDIQKIINSLKNCYSTGYDSISTKVVKSVSHIISPLISHIINLCIEKGEFPERLKIGIVKPLFKKGDRKDMASYRPVTLLPVFSKVIEKVIYNSIYDYFETNNLFAPEQMGFRKGKTINMAIFKLMHVILTNIDKRIPVSALYMDMSKAFDFVDHRILLDKLHKYGVRGNVHDLIHSYLSNRKQLTQINRICVQTKTESTYSSKIQQIHYGVPQGSVLGPLLFIIYINDLPKAIEYPTVLFADDSTILFACKNIESYENDINMTLETVVDWLTTNNLKINLEKTKIMYFKQRVNTFHNLNISYKGQHIDETDSTRFLGLSVDNKLTWRFQIDNMCKKLNQFSYALYNLRKVVNESAVLTAYHAYVTSTLRYGIIFWANSVEREMAFKAQKRCIRSLCGIHQLDSCKPYFQKLRILTLPCLYIFEVIMFVRRNLHLYPSFRSTRLRNKISGMSFKTALFRKSLLGMAPTIYNKVPKDIIDIDNIADFKNKLFKILVKKAYYTVKEFLTDSN
jgi:hypothetical protein